MALGHVFDSHVLPLCHGLSRGIHGLLHAQQTYIDVDATIETVVLVDKPKHYPFKMKKEITTTTFSFLRKMRNNNHSSSCSRRRKQCFFLLLCFHSFGPLLCVRRQEDFVRLTSMVDMHSLVLRLHSFDCTKLRSISFSIANFTFNGFCI